MLGKTYAEALAAEKHSNAAYKNNTNQQTPCKFKETKVEHCSQTKRPNKIVKTDK